MTAVTVDRPRARESDVHQLVVLAKYWQAGTVKTRLGARIGGHQAARLHRLFLETVLRRCELLPGRKLLAFTPCQRREEFDVLAERKWYLQPQPEGHLGHRMRHIAATATTGTRGCVLLGADSPNLPLEHLQQAMHALEQTPVVLGPARDGGYYLLGLRDTDPDIFDGIAWGTGEVLSRTIQRLERQGTEFALLPQWYDVDRWDDLQCLANDLKHQAAGDPWLARLEQAVAEVISKAEA